MRNLLPKTLPDFQNRKILVLGDVMLDRYLFGDTSRISPEAPIPIVKISHCDDRPGGAANVALNIAALGAKVILIGATGDDSAATTLREQLDNSRVEHYLTSTKEIDTIIKLRVLSRHQQLLRLDFEKKLPLSLHASLQKSFEQVIHEVDLVILSDYLKGTLSDPQSFIQTARKAKVPVLVDPKGQNFNIYRHAEIITPNLKEFETIMGSCESEQEIFRKGRELLQQYDINALLITRSEDGMTLIQNNQEDHLPAYAREVFDVTGAGDTVIATLGVAVAAELPLLSATALANLAASLVVGKLGAASISKPELQAAIYGKKDVAQGIVDEEQLLIATKLAQSQGKKIVFTNGCFDILHAGHVTTLQMAKQLGDYLIVAVNTDDSIKKIKGEHRPINTLDQRMTVLAGLGVVDWVVPFSDDTPERLLKLIKPDLLAKGADYTIDKVVGADIVKAYGGEVRIMNHNIKTSSSSILDKLETHAMGN